MLRPSSQDESSEKPAVTRPRGGSPYFQLMAFRDYSNVYIKYGYSKGPDWEVLDGLENGVTQFAQLSSSRDRTLIWNFPLDISFRSFNAFGWPRLVVSAFGIDGAGREVVIGYGSLLLPTVQGTYTREIYLYTPIASSYFIEMLSWITGRRPEFFSSTFVSEARGREATRVRCTGKVCVQMNVITRKMALCGFVAGPSAQVVAHLNR